MYILARMCAYAQRTHSRGNYYVSFLSAFFSRSIRNIYTCFDSTFTLIKTSSIKRKPTTYPRIIVIYDQPTLLHLSDRIREGIENGISMVLVQFDFCKAFLYAISLSWLRFTL